MRCKNTPLKFKKCSIYADWRVKMYNILQTYYVYQTTPYDLNEKAEKRSFN